jgi:hypothetical protein
MVSTMTGMFIRPCYRQKNGKRHAYWALMESYRTERRPRQRVVAYLGQLEEASRRGVKNAAEGNPKTRQKQLFDETKPHGVEVDVKRLRVENRRDFGGPWLGLQLVEQLSPRIIGHGSKSCRTGFQVGLPMLANTGQMPADLLGNLSYVCAISNHPRH